MKIIKVTALGAKEKMLDWIANRGGIQVWDNVNLSDMGAGEQFTPALTENGEQMGKPHWSVARGELITDIKRFKFAVSFVEVKRFHVAVQRGSGLGYKATDGSMRKLDRYLDAAREKYGDDVYYRKDGGLFNPDREIVIEYPIWEAEGSNEPKDCV
jgi:hypothetical protein